MNNFLEAIGVGISVSLIFSVILGFIAFMRYLSYRETIELAQRGMLHPRHRRPGSGTTRSMRAGIIISAIGMALTCGLFTIGFEPGNTVLGPWMIGGLLPLSIGGALILIGWINQRDVPPSGDASIEINLEDDDPIPPHKMS
ncbi:MAG: hypothetical protein ACPG8W_05860 [Candidatus Promineifilaceae bacterium]